MSALDNIIKAAVKQAAKKAGQTASKTAAKKVAAKATAKTAKKVVAKTTKKVASKANPKNSYTFGRAVVHGSPTKGLKKITPHKGSAALPDESVVFAWDPKGFGRRGDIANYVQEYTRGTGSAYVGKVPRSAVKKQSKGVVAATKPMKVKEEISGSDFAKLEKEINRALLKSGAVKKPTKVGAKSKAQRVVRKAEDVARKNKKISKKLSQFQNRNSVA